MGKFSLFSPPLGAFGGAPQGDSAAVELDGANHEPYANVHGDPNASFCSQYYFAPGYATFLGQSCQNSIFGDVWYRIKRTSLAFETSILAGLTPTLATLRIQPNLSYYTRNYATLIDAVLAPGTHRPAIASDYGVIGGDNTVIGSLNVPFPGGLSDAYHDIAIPVADLNLGGYVLWALRSDDDVTATVPPGCNGVGPIGYNNMVGIKGASAQVVATYFPQFPHIVSLVQVGPNAVATGRLNDPTPWPGVTGQPPRLDITVAEAVDGSNLDIRFYYFSDTHPGLLYTPWQLDVALDTNLSVTITPPAGSTSLTVGFQMRLNHNSAILMNGGEINIPFSPISLATVETDPGSGNFGGASFNGTLLDEGGEPCDCGFQWGTTPALGSTTGTTSHLTGETFLAALPGFTFDQRYYFRTFATNSAGTAFGATVSFIMTKKNRAYPLSRAEV